MMQQPRAAKARILPGRSGLEVLRTRREFIKQVIASSTLFGASSSQVRSAVRGATRFSAQGIKTLQDSLSAGLVLPDDAEFETARRVKFWNPLTDMRPAMIARCAGPEDVARCLEFAQKHQLAVAVRSGGHSFLGWGTCDGGFVLDVGPLKKIEIDPNARTAQVGAGVTAQELVVAASRHGLAPVLGKCATVGVAGLTLGGGLGWLSGKYGAACDNLLSANFVTTESRALVANATSNPDLFWAIRGGGGNFGVATSFTYQLYKVSEVVAGGFAYNLRDARSVLNFYRTFMADAPDELQALAYLTPAGGGALNVVIVHSGDGESGETVAKNFRAFIAPVRDTIRRRSYNETFTMTLFKELEMPASGEFTPNAFRSDQGCYIETLSEEVIDIALERFSRAPPGCRIGFDHYVHGAVCRIPRASTAFELRAPGALHSWTSAAWNDPSAAIASMSWATETWTLLQPYSGGRIYANYMSLEGETATKAVYGSNLSRLARIKEKYDPNNFFRRNQNIHPRAL